MRRADGDSRLSESAVAVASTRKVQVVSNDIFRRGDAECLMPVQAYRDNYSVRGDGGVGTRAQ
jgi:hypothetical protein